MADLDIFSHHISATSILLVILSFCGGQSVVQNKNKYYSMGTASVIGGKTLRACDSCVCHRARWYCAADDAFLCQSCDSSVRSANPLARRHHRVRLQTCRIKKDSKCNKLAPTWHHGFKQKARTPRPSPKAKNSSGRGVLWSLVPEIEASAVEEGSNEAEEQLLYRVPIFDPVLAEFYLPTLVHESNLEAKPTVQFIDSNTNSNSNSDCFSGLIQSDAELAEFAADMERGRVFENDSFSMEELGIVDTKNNELVKEEFIDNNEKNDTVVDDVKMYQVIDLSRETLEIDFDCRSGSDEVQVTDEYEEGKTKIGLRLEYYQAVSVEWSAHGCLSPWMNGERPQLGLDDCSLTTQLGMWGVEKVQGVVCSKVGGVHIDEEREARVSRYLEKRRTRLFSRKIRYQVRKLNAEKRPRMKGRFVKRVSF